MSHRYEGPRSNKTVKIDHHTVQVIIKVVRDLVIFFLGAYAFYHELTRDGSERPQILIMSAAMMGLPLIIRGDEKRQESQANAIKQRDSRHNEPTT